MKVGILSEYPTVAVQSGPALHTKFLHDGLVKRNHKVVLMGPDTTGEAPAQNEKVHLFKGVPYPSHPKTKVPVPFPLKGLARPPKLDVIHGQTNSHMIEYANWMRKMHRTAVLSTNIIHLPTHSHFILSDKLYGNPVVRELAKQSADGVEKDFARMYNEGDGLIVQSRYMVDYWRSRGVNVPIDVVGRPIDPSKFSAQPGPDPYPQHFKVGSRMVVVCRHDREKNIEQLITIFDEHVAPANPHATLTLVGHGHAHLNYVEQARRSRYANRIFFPGEVKHGRLVDWLAHADLFVYTSLSETFGNVINEALWTGLPVVALNDRMGVAHQVLDGVNGFLVDPHRIDTEPRFARACLEVLENRALRRKFGENAATLSRRTSHPDVVLSRFEKIYERATKNAHDSVKEPLSEQNVIRQRMALAKHTAVWARWSYTLLAIGTASFKLKMGRKMIESNLDLRAEDTGDHATIAPARTERVLEAAE